MHLASDTETGVIKSIGVGLISFADALKTLKPHMVVLLGDRFELFCAGIAALMLRIPIVHIHGGETSQGAVDEAVRHSTTKLASIHFPATETYRRRIIQMGENPEYVFNYGAPGLDWIYKLPLMDRKALQDRLGFDMTGRIAILTYHPVTLETNTARKQIRNILDAVKKTDLKVVFTKANADVHGRVINKIIQEFCVKDPVRYRFIDNLGQVAYLSCLKCLDLMIGNSSSGLTEAPSFRLPVVNVGDRQKGRIKADNVIDAGYGKDEIMGAIEEALSEPFKKRIKRMKNPYDKYGDGQVSHRIKEKLKEIKISSSFVKKRFHDIEKEGA
jgi:UDP-hydrolysing UDP-N-acetyl-D-glucosamine 2-epimerase